MHLTVGQRWLDISNIGTKYYRSQVVEIFQVLEVLEVLEDKLKILTTQTVEAAK